MVKYHTVNENIWYSLKEYCAGVTHLTAQETFVNKSLHPCHSESKKPISSMAYTVLHAQINQSVITV